MFPSDLPFIARRDNNDGRPLPVRVKGGMSLRNGMWHGLRNDIIMRNLIYADRFQRNKLNTASALMLRA